MELNNICKTLLLGREMFDCRIGACVKTKKEISDFVNNITQDQFFKKSKQKFVLSISNLPKIENSDVKRLLKLDIFKHVWNNIMKCLDNLGIDRDIKDFENTLIYQYVACYSYILALLEIMESPRMIAASGTGVWVALTVCNMANIDDILAVLADKKELNELEISSPSIPFYDSSSCEIIDTFQFNESYVKTLMRGLEIQSAEVYNLDVDEIINLKEIYNKFDEIPKIGMILMKNNEITSQQLEEVLMKQKETALLFGDIVVNMGYCTQEVLDNYLGTQKTLKENIEKAKMLNISQYTFKKFIEEWNNVTTKYGIDIIEIINNRSKDPNFLNSKRKSILLMFVILSSIKRLDKKWNLSDVNILESAEFNEVLDLIVDEVMPKDLLVKLLINDNPDYEEAATILRKRQERYLNKQNQYKLLRKYSKNIISIKNTSEWINKLISISNIDVDNLILLDIFCGTDQIIWEDNLLNLWLKGIDIKWKIIIKKDYRKFSLPTYMFNKDLFLFSSLKNKESNETIASPLLDKDISTSQVIRFIRQLPSLILSPLSGGEISDDTLLDNGFQDSGGVRTPPESGILFMKTLKSNEFFVSDHLINGKRILPGVVFIEMAKTAGDKAFGKNVTTIKETVWLRPIEVDSNSKNIFITLSYLENNQSRYEVYSINEIGEKLINAQGKIILEAKNQHEISAQKENFMPGKEAISVNVEEGLDIDVNKCYNFFNSIGLQYQNAFRSIKKITSNQKETLVYLELPSACDDNFSEFSLHPSIMDGALQACIVFLYNKEEKLNGTPLPFSISEVQILRPLTKKCYIHVIQTKSSVLKFDIRILNNSWEELVIIKDFLVRMIEKPKNDLIYFRNIWEKSSFTTTGIKDIKKVIYHQKGNGEEDIFELFAIVQDLIKQKVKDRITIMYVNKGNSLYCKAISAFGKVVNLENPKITFKSLQLEGTRGQDVGSDRGRFLDTLALVQVCQGTVPCHCLRPVSNDEKIIEEELYSDDVEIKYENGNRYIKVFKEFIPDSFKNLNVPIKENGVYLITGGMGGLGQKFAKVLLKTSKCKIVLIGRSEIAEDVRNNLDKNIFYMKADISKKEDVATLVNEIKSKHGHIDGVIHAAGVLRDSFILKKSTDQIKDVLAPKVYGLQYLDEALQEEQLDFFVTFSSIIGLIGNIGQCDYAYANRFMDEYIQMKSEESSHCKYLSINWPLWKNGGMKVDEETEIMLDTTFAMKAMSDEEGIKVFFDGLTQPYPCFAVIEGNIEKIRQQLRIKITENNETFIIEKVQKVIKGFTNEILGIKLSDIDVEADISEFGFDSITFTQLSNRLNDYYKINIMPSVFFEHNTLEFIVKYLIENYEDKITEIHKPDLEKQYKQDNENITAKASRHNGNSKIIPDLIKENTIRNESNKNQDYDPIAIIGIAGVLPKSEDLEIFWENLINGVNMVSEIPKDRWDWEEYYGDPNKEANKTDIKYGGFIPDIDKFDPLFFGISPKEAELMDPQQRIFLQVVWHAIEDSGHKASDLSGTKTGIYVGVLSSSDYFELLNQNNIEVEAQTSTGMFHSILANRISYILNLNGPSEAIDTACSSSLVAIHHAVRAIQEGECDMAIAGGINAILTPTMHISFNKSGMLSKDGCCKTFDKSANGYVRGEGAGAILLKPLSKAIEDGDHIYALIKGIAINHGGHVNSLTVPNPNAQADLISMAWSKAGGLPTYIEAHGTGTSLGDPIEINGIKKAFNEIGMPNECALGSVKSNIGHLESAAGIAGVLKVLLSMKYRKIPKNLNFTELNPYIDLANTPFYVANDLIEWNPHDDIRRAGVSSFGFGGVNAHVVLQEVRVNKCEMRNEGSSVFVLSAKNEERLKEYANKLANYFEKNRNESLADISYTLQVGRESMPCRLAFIASNMDELIEKLHAQTMEIKKLNEICKLWVYGEDVDFNKLYGDKRPNRVSLPGYPFAKEKYWIPGDEDGMSFEEIEIEEDTNEIDENDLLDKINESLIAESSKLLKIKKESIESDIELGELGFDSITFTKFANIINEKFSLNIMPSYFFEYSTIDEIKNNLLDVYKTEFVNYFGDNLKTLKHKKVLKSINLESKKVRNKNKNTANERFEPIAIIGMAGVMPKSPDLETFWQNLISGVDMISEIPKERWNWEDYLDQTKVKYGGFMPDIDKFDPLFFGISPKEAELMDPQQRIFLEVVWKTIEDSGYSTSSLAGTKTGLFVGVATADYTELINKSGTEVEAQTSTGMFHSILTNRISYLLDFRSPSEPIDTACSSSLVAIHRAVQSIHAGESDMALAGGVNVIITPTLFISFSKVGMLAEDGQCKTFDKNANGYVRGEGAGAILLKPLSKAIEDRDHIYAVIKGTAENHGGHANSLTAPNPNAQAELIINAWKNAGGLPSYIEAHGTGTSLGDPIEINAIKKAFDNLGMPEKCVIGSVKTNIGHLETAAGIVGIIKVLLAMKYKKIPGNLHFKELNPYIELTGTSFCIADRTIDWECKDLRRAGVSSFGFGGVNAHVVLEEYINREKRLENKEEGPYIIVISAKTKDRLQEYAEDILIYLNDHRDTFIADIAYTLQIGRDAMEERLAIIATDISDLKLRLESYNQDKHDVQGIYTGNIRENKKRLEVLISVSECSDIIKDIIQNKKHVNIAKFWVWGLEIEWKNLYREGIPKRINLPTYPFAKERYWIPNSKAIIKNELLILTKQWKKSEINTKWPKNITGTLIILNNDENLNLTEELLKWNDNIRIITLQNDFLEIESINELVRAEELILGVFDFSDIYEEKLDEYILNIEKIKILQVLINNIKGNSFFILHFTKGLQEFKTKKMTLAGAEFAGIVKMLSTEYGKVVSRTIDIDDSVDIIKVISDEIIADSDDSEACYRNGIRYVPYMKKHEVPKLHKKLAKFEFVDKEKVVVITGGTRGIGIEVAKHIVKSGIRKLVLMGVKEIPPQNQWTNILTDNSIDKEMKNKIENFIGFEKAGVTLSIYSGGLSDKEKLADFFIKIRQTLGPIGGVIHAAGLSINNSPAFINKDITDICKVFEPKIFGLQVLHKIFKDDNLEFFILFSSVSGVLPSLASGVSDYAAANSYMDYFTKYQNNKGNIYYKSINWPNWKEVGMGEVTSPIYKQLGFTSHSTDDGIYMLDLAANFNQDSCIMPCIVDKEKFDIEKLLLVFRGDTIRDLKSNKQLRIPVNTHNKSNAYSDTKQWLFKIFSEQLKIKIEDLQDDIPFGEFGVDSIMIAEIVKKIEVMLNININPSILLENPTIASLSKFIYENYKNSNLEDNNSLLIRGNGGKSPIREAPKLPEAPQPCCHRRWQQGLISTNNPKIAVIGLSCNFPGARNKDEFWNNLLSGVSSIREIPKNRWDIKKYYSPTYEEGKSISKWGGFIDDIEYFDPEYFNITEKEAPHIDPLIRQFLEASVNALQDAGYKKEELWGKEVGVFVGSRAANYASKIDKFIKNSIIGLGQNFIAAHIAHFFNFTGPNMVVDTACSSSLVSIHLACQSLLSGESEVAIAGGVDILLDEKLYIILSEARALSPNGKCHTFDENANGFVPGEGCGVVLLKPLDRAINDGDRIYAVIEATAVNNDGHTMGITTPNPEKQYEVIKKALKQGNINPETVSYIEAHGTGTMIGDPIELKALTRAFRESTDKKQFCAVGSVKTNFGHLLSAAGIAGVIKIILSMQNKKIPPTLNCKVPNPRFEFEDSPFYLNTSLLEWNVVQDARRAGISSFGFGGTNAHLILCDYKLKENARTPFSLIMFNKKRYWASEISDDMLPFRGCGGKSPIGGPWGKPPSCRRLHNFAATFGVSKT